MSLKSLPMQIVACREVAEHRGVTLQLIVRSNLRWSYVCRNQFINWSGIITTKLHAMYMYLAFSFGSSLPELDVLNMHLWPVTY